MFSSSANVRLVRLRASADKTCIIIITFMYLARVRIDRLIALLLLVLRNILYRFVESVKNVRHIVYSFMLLIMDTDTIL